MQNDEKLQDCIAQFSNKYSKAKLVSAIEGFQWARDSKEASLQKRKQLSMTYHSWVTSGANSDSAEDMANAVYKWGFGNRNSPPSLSANLTLFCELNRHWYSGQDRQKMTTSLSEFLELKGIGIASASKWICFADENRFAIYDSRVSAALRAIKVSGKVVFPTVGRRPVSGKKYPYATPRTNDQMAHDYLFFIDFVNDIAKRYGIDSPAEIEMGLFMLGDKEENWT